MISFGQAWDIACPAGIVIYVDWVIMQDLSYRWWEAGRVGGAGWSGRHGLPPNCLSLCSLTLHPGYHCVLSWQLSRPSHSVTCLTAQSDGTLLAMLQRNAPMVWNAVRTMLCGRSASQHWSCSEWGWWVITSPPSRHFIQSPSPAADQQMCRHT